MLYEKVEAINLTLANTVGKGHQHKKVKFFPLGNSAKSH